VRVFRVLAVLTFGAAVAAQAQLAITQPTEKLLLLPLSVTTPADSAASIATMDVARARLVQMARYKATVIPKAKICEALLQSGFPCDGLMTEVQAGQLARALSINNYNTGVLQRTGGQLVAKLRIISGGSGFASSFTLSGAAPDVLGEAVAQRLLSIIRAAEYARNCTDQRSRNALDRAAAEARKAFAIEPDLASANLCVATVYEVQRAPVDSMIAAAHRALRGDSSNTTAWSMIASKLLVKGDTTGAIDAFRSMLTFNPSDKNLRLAIAQQMLQHKSYADAEALLEEGLKLAPGDQQLGDLRKRACIEGGLYSCTLGILREEANADSTKLADTTVLKLALANAQAAPDTQAMLWWARAAAVHFPNSVTFIKQLAGAFVMVGQNDSAITYYKKALAVAPGDVATSLLIAKTIVDNAVWDTASARRLQEAKDTVGLRRLREPFAAHLDSARAFLAPGFSSSDPSIRLFTINVAYSGGSKLAQASSLDLAYQWLDEPYQQLSLDTITSHQPLRSITGYWYGLASTYTMPPLLQQLGTSKKCDMAPALNDRIQKTKQALNLGARVAPQAVRAPLATIGQFENFMQQVKRSFKCRNF
jgi:tetratricopeptide (TPR) repeat protein